MSTNALATRNLRGTLDSFFPQNDDAPQQKTVNDNDLWRSTLAGVRQLRQFASRGGGTDAARRALDDLLKAADIAPDEVEFQHQLGLSWATLGELTSSDEAFAKAVVAYDTAKKSLEKTECDKSLHLRIQINQAVALRFLALSEIDGNNKLNILKNAETMIRSALNSLTISNDFDKTLIIDFPRAQNALGNILIEQGDVVHAIEIFKQARDSSLGMRDEHIRSICNIGNALLKQHMHQDAINYFDEALKCVPDDKDSILAWGYADVCRCLAFSRYGDALYSENIEHARELYLASAEGLVEIRLKINPDISSAIWAFATYELGSIHKRFGKSDDAIRLLIDAIQYLGASDREIAFLDIEDLYAIKYGMPSDKDPVSAVKTVLTNLGVPQEEWASVFAEVTRRNYVAGSETKNALNIPLPEKARIKYSDRSSDPNLANLGIIDFLRAEYGPWLDGTLTRPDLKRLDPSAYTALANWLRTKQLPVDIIIPTKSDVVTDQLTRVDAAQLLTGQRLAQARRRRSRHPDA